MSIASSSLLDLASQAPSAMALHKKYIVGAHRAPLQLRTQAVGAVYDRPGFFVQSPSAMVKLFMKRNTRHDRGRRDGIADGGLATLYALLISSAYVQFRHSQQSG